MSTRQQLFEFEKRHGFSYRIGVNDKYHLKDSLEIDNSLANLLEKKLEDLYILKKTIKDNHIPEISTSFKSLFTHLDANRDGQISKIEFWKFFTDVVRLNIDITKLFKDSSTTLNLSEKVNIQRNIAELTKEAQAAQEAQVAQAAEAAKAAEAAEAAQEAQAAQAAREAQAKAEAAARAKAEEAQAARAKKQKLEEYLELHDNINTFNRLFDVNLFDETKVETVTKDKVIKLYGMLDENFDNQLNESEIINGLNINATDIESKDIKKILIEIFELLVKKISIMIDLANIKSKLQHEYEADDNYDFDTQKNHLKYLFHSLEISEKFLLKLKSTGYKTINLQNDIRLLLDIHLCISIEDERPIKQMTGCYKAIYKQGEASTGTETETIETDVILSAKYDQDMPIDKTNKSGLNNINNLLKLLDELQSFIYIFLKNEINLIHVLKECKLQLLKAKEKLEILRINFSKSYIKEQQLSIEGSQAVHHIQVSPPGQSEQSRAGSEVPLGHKGQIREGSVGSSQQSRDQTPVNKGPGKEGKEGGGKKKKEKKKSMEFKF